MVINEADAAAMRSPGVYEFASRAFRPLVEGLGGYAVGGVDNLRPVDGQGYLAAPTHQSNWDHFALGLAMQDLPELSRQEQPDLPPLQPRGLHWMAKKELFTFPGIKHFAEWCNAFPVDRGTGKGLPEELVTYIRNLMDSESVMVMYPQGHRYPSLSRDQLKSTVAFLALTHGKPIVPIGIFGRTKGPKFPRAVYFEKPIFSERMEPDHPDFSAAKQALMDQVYEGMNSGSDHARELHADIESQSGLVLQVRRQLRRSQERSQS